MFLWRIFMVDCGYIALGFVQLRRNNPVRQVRRDHLEMAHIPGIDAFGVNLAGAGQ
jgi:hypothetical protein